MSGSQRSSNGAANSHLDGAARLDGSRKSVTATRADLADAVYRKIGLSRAEAASLVETVLEEIAVAISKGENVKLSSFGSFRVRSKGERVGRNPKTGVEVPITPRRVIVFKPSNVMKARVNGDIVVDGADED